MKLDDRKDSDLYTWESKKKKSNGNGVCAEYRRLRKRARQNARRYIHKAIRDIGNDNGAAA